MPIVRGVSDISTLPPNVYVNELPTPDTANVQMGDFVLAVVGDFDRGPLNSYVYVEQTPTVNIVDAVKTILGEKADSGKAGNQVLTHIDAAKVKKAVFVRLLGSGSALATLTLKDRASTALDTLQISAKYPGTYANTFTAQVANGTSSNTFKLILTSDIGGVETYDNLVMDSTAARYAPTIINAASAHFVLADLNSATTKPNNNPAVLAQTQLSGGNNGATLAASDYIGAVDSGTGKKTGLKLLEDAGAIVTDVCFANHSAATSDAALKTFSETYNTISYCGTGTATTLANTITYKNTYDTDFMQIVFGNFYANTGATISGAALSAIVHVISNIEDSGLSIECTWISGTDSALSFTDEKTAYQNQISCFVLKPSAAGNGTYAWRMGNDYTMAVTDVEGNVISDNENRKVNKRRLNSWIEKGLFNVAAPWQGKAFTKVMKQNAENKLRSFLDNLKTPLAATDNPKIEGYKIEFDQNATLLDQFVTTLKVKHYNTGEWILLNFMGGTNVTGVK